ncbi:MAG TPA: hypothetical protein PKM50_04615 [Methanoregula sp.]|nr:hypothetical protein [Methanoregula sp.]
MNEEIDFRFLKEQLLKELSQPCEIRKSWDGAEIFEAGNPPEVVVRFTPFEIQVYRPSYYWRDPAVRMSDPQLLGTVYLQQLDNTVTALIICQSLINCAREQRRESFRKCRFCGETFGPEGGDDDVCHGCEERYLFIVH